MIPVIIPHHHRGGRAQGKPKNPLAALGAGVAVLVGIVVQNLVKAGGVGSGAPGKAVAGGIVLGLVCALIGFVAARVIGRQGRV